jgi:hypothetical protein
MIKTLAHNSRIVPGPIDLVFLIVLTTLLVGGPRALLNDPGTPWHLRLGREILVRGDVPRFDTLTFTRGQAPWVDQSWGFDVILALVVDSCGWPAVIVLASVGLAMLYASVARDLIADGTSPVVAATVAVLVSAVSSIHFLIRPHLFTFAFVYLTFRACQKQHKAGGWAVALVPIYTAVLANLHGGFVALPVIVATAAIGHAISGPWDAARRRTLVRFVGAALACGLAALVNPYGFGLYRHVVHLLFSSGVTSLIVEYQPAPFGQPEAKVLEWVLLALVALQVVSAQRIERYHLVHVVVWLHMALTSIRNAPFFALASAPALATLLDGLPLALRTSWKRDGRQSIWPSAAVLSLLLLIMSGAMPGSFDKTRWPLAALPALNKQPTATHLFHEQDWGGLIAAECQPVRPSYLDDRFELFGKKAILEYVDVLSGGPVWDTIRERDKIEMVWVRPERGLAKRLLQDPGWSVIYRDKVSILFGQEPASRLTAR